MSGREAAKRREEVREEEATDGSSHKHGNKTFTRTDGYTHALYMKSQNTTTHHSPVSFHLGR